MSSYVNTNVSRGYSYIKQSLSRFRRRALALNGPCSHYAVATCNVRLLLLGEDARVQEDIVGSPGISPRSIAAFTHMGFAPSPSLLTPPQDRLPTMTFLVDIIDFLRKD